MQMSLIPTLLSEAILGKDAPIVPGTDPDIGLFCTVNLNPIGGLALPLLLGGKD